jgi:two-component system, cell cycle sensor histidine kinase and response regulator CckA
MTVQTVLDIGAVFDAALEVSLIATDREGTIVGFSRGAEQLLGYAADELVGKVSSLAFHDPQEVATRAQAASQQLHRPVAGFQVFIAWIELGHGRADEWTYVRKDGARLTVHLSMSALRDRAGEVIGYLGSAIDITERKQAEQALMQEKHFIEQVLNSLPGIFYLYDSKLRLRRWNRNHESLLGFSASEMEGRYLGDWHATGPERDMAVAASLGVLASGGSPDAVESTLRHKDGRPIPFLLTGTRVDSPTGPMLAGFGIDLTERHRLEALLRQAQRLESVGRVAGGIAHDFNNILTVIAGNLDLARDKAAGDAELLGFLDHALSAGESASRLTRQLLAFSRKQVIQPLVADVSGLLVNVRAMLSRLLGESIELRTITGKDLWKVKIDPGQFDQIMLNLAVNARDAMPDGGLLSIECKNEILDDDYVRRHADVAPGEYVCIAVSDTGVGMDQSVLAQVFEPFFTTKEMGRGTGLGLATVFGAVKQNGGVIAAYSEPGMGTTFRVYLPRCRDGADAEPPSQPSPPQASGEHKGETILIAEDDEQIRAIAAQGLARLGYRVIVCSNGAQAFDAAVAAAPVHLLITDVVMPDMNGRELSERLLLRQPKMKVLFTSGYTADIIGRHGILDPGTEFLPKPYGPKDLARRVREVLDGRAPDEAKRR